MTFANLSPTDQAWVKARYSARPDVIADRIEEEVRLAKNDPEFGFEVRIRLLLSFNDRQIRDDPKTVLQPPHDYKYEDGEPDQVVTPRVLFGDEVDLSASERSREAFAAWLTSDSNPRFALNLANRIWNYTFGLALHEPVDNLANLDQAQNRELLEYLAEAFRAVDFDVRELRRAVYYSAAWQREATREGPSVEEMGTNAYPFPGPVLRRMTAHDVRAYFQMDFARTMARTRLRFPRCCTC